MDKIKTTGMIQYVIDNEPGVIRYIVAVNLNGCTVKAIKLRQTVGYI